VTAGAHALDSRRFRQVLGNYPTGVSVITAIDVHGVPVGMAVGTFTSVSLDPPLVAFLPDKTSTSFPRIRTAASFCVNVLAADQDDVCRAFAARGGDKFAEISWSPAPSGAPRLDGVAAWIDCDLHSVGDAGDHLLVMGRVRDLDGDGNKLPLVFFQGGYGRFSPLSLVAMPEPDIIGHLRHADLARGELERIAAETGAECVATAAVGDQLVVVAGAGDARRSRSRTRVGQRSPFLPPLGALFVAGTDDVDAWLDQAGPDGGGTSRGAYRSMLERVRERGWSLSLADATHTELERALGRYSDGDRSPAYVDHIRSLAAAAADLFEPAGLVPDASYAARLISAPVIDSGGRVVLLLTLWGLPPVLSGAQIARHARTLQEAASRVGAALGTGSHS
jgi:flavin reductase (DIM6/NTAB) family NADH-FMN oxidoreductase RutF/DNA-binding IclR family transcriptional regulator